MMKSAISTLAIAVLLPLSLSANAATLAFTKDWTFQHTIASEIVSFDDLTGNLWVTGGTGLDILDLGGNKLSFIDLSSFGNVNSVAVYNGIAAVAIENTNRSSNGIVQFYNTSTNALMNTVTVGALPDMVKFTPDGSKLLVANEGTPNFNEDLGINEYGTLIPSANFPKSFNPAINDPVGSVSIIDMNTFNTTTATLNGVPTSGSHIRTNTGMDFEPEYIAVNATGTKAYVSLQEANAIGILDINSGTFEEVIGLGVKDFSLPGNQIDPKDGNGIAFGSYNVKGLYMPDGIEAYQANGQTYLVMANEGDFREDDADKARAGSALAVADPLNRLQISITDSSANDLYVPGARSFSIRDESGNIIYDSGDILDKTAAALGIYNDGRSDDKGVEPEGVSLLDIAGRTYAFIGLERTTQSAIGVFDITDPNNVSFLDMLVSNGDISPEGLQAFNYNGDIKLVFSNEVSKTTSLYSIQAVPEPHTYLMLLLGFAVIGAMQRRRK